MTSPSPHRGRRRRAEVDRRPPPPVEAPHRSLGLSFWAALLAGAWLGRVSVALPSGIGTVFDLLLPVAAGLFVFLSYRRWIRARIAASAAERSQARRRPSAPQE
jgi:hypothetical protein